MRIVIYGLSRTTFFVEETLKREHTVVGYSDGIAQISKYHNIPFIPAENLRGGIEFDYIIIAVESRSLSDEIRYKLVNEIGISAEKIIDCKQILNGQRVDNVMRLSDIHYSGIILGNSHAAKGINPRCLTGKWCNLANGGEDIYYHFVTLKICKERYWERIKELRYLIIDLWDYEVFNYDTSRTTGIAAYWSHGGIMEDIHNYNSNANYHVQPCELLREHGFYSPSVSEADKALADELFDFSIVKEKYDDLYRNNGSSYLFYGDYPSEHRFGKNLVLPDYLFMKKAEHKYKDTIEENIEVFDKLVRLAKEINEKIKIILLLTPRLSKIEKIHGENIRMLKWKGEFEKIVYGYVNDNIRYFNMKNLRVISENNCFYEDVGHMNAVGAAAYTSYLNDYILNWDS